MATMGAAEDPHDPGRLPHGPASRLVAAEHRRAFAAAPRRYLGLGAADLGALDLGRQLRRLGDTGGPWWIVLTAGETKSGKPYEAAWPEELQAPLERHLARWRPVLLGPGSGPGGAATARLWVSANGRPLRPEHLHFLVTRATGRRLGVEINPHLLRGGATTELAVEDPAHAGAASPLLGHRPSSATAAKHYNLAGQREAARAWQEHVRELRRKARRGRRKG